MQILNLWVKSLYISRFSLFLNDFFSLRIPEVEINCYTFVLFKLWLQFLYIRTLSLLKPVLKEKPLAFIIHNI